MHQEIRLRNLFPCHCLLSDNELNLQLSVNPEKVQSEEAHISLLDPGEWWHQHEDVSVRTGSLREGLTVTKCV
jgi:hypothetical protein